MQNISCWREMQNALKKLGDKCIYTHIMSQWCAFRGDYLYKYLTIVC